MSQYTVYLYNIPRIDESGTRAIPVDEGQRRKYGTLDEAAGYASTRKSVFDRVVVIHCEADEQELLHRYIDGRLHSGGSVLETLTVKPSTDSFHLPAQVRTRARR